MNKKLKIALICSTAFITITTTTGFLTSCSNAQNYAFGNFQSYISPSIINSFNDNYKNVNWQYYASNKQIPTYLQNKTLNACVATNNTVVNLITKKLINQIDWAKYELLEENTNQVITNVSQLESIYTPIVWNICQNAFSDFVSQNLLTYAMPYFLQNVVFVYRGNEIPQLEQPNLTFTDIFNFIETNKAFKAPNKGHNILMVDDPRLLYGISEILKCEKNNTPVNINPRGGLLNQSPDQTPSQQEFSNTYKLVKDFIYNKNAHVGLQSDSNVIINKLVKNEIQGAFFYNGDAAFAAQGGDYPEHSNITPENFHVVIPKNNIVALDLMVTNITNDPSEQIESLNFIYQLALSGLKTNTYNKYNLPIVKSNLDSKLQDIIDTDPNTDEYIYSSMINFDYVNYTPTINAIMNFVTSGYFPSDDPMKQILIELLDIKEPANNNPKNYVEMPLNDLAEVRMQTAYLDLKVS